MDHNARSTTRVTLGANLDPSDLVPAAAFDAADPDSYNHATSATVYDEDGNEVALAIYFRKSAGGRWAVYGTANGQTLAAPGGQPAPLTTLGFAPDGTGAQGTMAQISIPPLPGATGLTRPIRIAAFDTSGCTQRALPFGVTVLEQDGCAAEPLAPGALAGAGQRLALSAQGSTWTA